MEQDLRQVSQAMQVVTSNLLYKCIMEELNNLLLMSDGLLLTVLGDDLVVVEVVGQLPDTLVLSGCRFSLEGISAEQQLGEIHPALQRYQYLLSFENRQGKSVGYLVYSGENIIPDQELSDAIGHISQLLDINQTFASLPQLYETQSKLKYQLNFFISTINNIFEPYDNLTMVRLYMEIISEMLLFPTAIVFELRDNCYMPIASRGINQQQLESMVLEAAPFLQYRNLSAFPTMVGTLNVQQLGSANYQLLQNSLAEVIIPLQVNNQPRYLLTCHAAYDKSNYSQNWRIITTLAQTFNNAIELNEVRRQILQANQSLDNKVFTLTSVYQAAEKILTIADINETSSMALDMLMEVFQSVTSSVFVHNFNEHRVELLDYKTITGGHQLSYWLATPEEMLQNQLVIDYNDPDQKQQFLTAFPDFAAIAEQLQPVLIVHLRQKERYYGFITLSNRMTEAPYTLEDKALLSMLSNSIAIALDNAWMMVKIQEQHRLLDQRLEELMAIQDALRIMREAASLPEFCDLLEKTMKIGLGAQLYAVIINKGEQLETVYGPMDLAHQHGQVIRHLTAAEKLAFSDDDSLLVVPINHPGRLSAYLVICGFTNTVLDDAQRLQLLDLIAAMLADTLAYLYELHCIASDDVLDYSHLLSHRLQQEADQLDDLGLSYCLVKFHHPQPAAVIKELGNTALGIIIYPQTGILIGRLPAERFLPMLSSLTTDYTVLPDLSPETLFL